MTSAPAEVTVSSEPVGNLAERVRADGTRFLLAVFVDMAGKPAAKLIPAEAVEQFEKEGANFAGPAAGSLSLAPGQPDLFAMPDAGSYMQLPFIRPGLALVHCDPHVGGKPWPYAPRLILKAAVSRAAERGLSLRVGAEVEYYLLKRDESGRVTTADPRDQASRPAYDLRGITRMYDHVTAVSAAMNALGWGNYSNEHEDGNGQFEQNFEHADALVTADRIITLRFLITALAERGDMTATFMPKPFSDRSGNGMHLNLSLWRGDEATFPDPGDPRGLGLSPLAYSFMAGIIEHAPGLQAVIAPTVNSYKRNSAFTSHQGPAWAPRSPNYGGNDRDLYLRVPEGNRVELRGTDGSANPYLATAAVLAAGLDGIARNLDPGQPGAKPDKPRPFLPPTLLHAVEVMVADREVCGALDAAGARVSTYFAELKRAEFFVWHSAVSDWEVDRYLTAF
jgi:glutamine synthetase